jgi:aspartyl/asparaginyl beta-hydroxylase (cupin superfamily)
VKYLAALAFILAITLGLLAVGVVIALRKVRRMPGWKKKVFLKRKLNGVYIWFEERGILPRNPAFTHDYHRNYPGLDLLEENFEIIREECVALMDIKDRLTDMSDVAGSYTANGVHAVRWKMFMFKAGEFIEENCRLCPKTTALLRRVPGVRQASFSVLDAHQHLPPHWGYYKGFVRYHLGVVVPGNNEDHSCYIRINSDPDVNPSDVDLRPKVAERVREGETYYWREGKGIVLEDNYLHEARNASDGVRVVLFLDLQRKLPFYLHLFNLLSLKIVYGDKSVQKIRERSLVATPPGSGS